MKVAFTIVLLCSLTINILCFTREEALSHWNECLREQKINKDDFQAVKKRKSSELDCFNACVMRKRGSIKNGKIDTEKFLSSLRQMGLLNKSRTEDLFLKCAALANKELNECATTKNMLDCFFVK